MTSVERVLEYCDIESEAPPVTEKRPPDNWPENGSISFKNMSLRYAPHLKDVLHRISCQVRPREKVSLTISVISRVCMTDIDNNLCLFWHGSQSLE